MTPRDRLEMLHGGERETPPVMRAVQTLLVRRPPRVRTEDRTLPRPDGSILPVRVYDPGTPGVRAVLVYIHGGGFVVGGLDDVGPRCSTLAGEAGVVVVSVDYRLLPKHVFPAALDDVLLAVRWVMDSANALRIDPARVAVGGGSAGGNLTAACALSHPADLPPLALLLLEEPWLDMSRRLTFEDPKDFQVAFAEETFACGEVYADGRDKTDPLLSPGLAGDLTGFPVTHLFVGDNDPLLGQAHAFLLRLRAAGVQAALHVFPGLAHGTNPLTRFLGPARDYETAMVTLLRSELRYAAAPTEQVSR